jgi:hypothetical protein
VFLGNYVCNPIAESAYKSRLTVTNKKTAAELRKESIKKKHKLNQSIQYLILYWGTCCVFISNLVNKKVLPVWKLAYSFSVYIILPENTHQYLFTAADNSPWNIVPIYFVRLFFLRKI